MDKFEQVLGQVSQDLKPKGDDIKVQQGDDVKTDPPVASDDSINAGAGEPKKDAQLEGLAPEKVFGFLDSNEDAYYEYLSKKIGREIKSLDDLTKVEQIEVIKEPELPEDV